MPAEGLLSANLGLVTLLFSEQCSKFETARSNGKQNIQFQNKINWQ